MNVVLTVNGSEFKMLLMVIDGEAGIKDAN